MRRVGGRMPKPEKHRMTLEEAIAAGEVARALAMVASEVRPPRAAAEAGKLAVNGRDVRGETPLHAVVAALVEGRLGISGAVDLVVALRMAGAMVNARECMQRNTPLHAALLGRAPGEVLMALADDAYAAHPPDTLLASGSAYSGIRREWHSTYELHASAANADGKCYLHLAAEINAVELAHYLLDRSERGAVGSGHALDVNSVDHEGSTALHIAALLGRSAIVELLVAHPDIQLDVCDSSGWTPLHMSTVGGHAATVETLLVAGSDLFIRTHEGSSVLDYCADEDDPDACEVYDVMALHAEELGFDLAAEMEAEAAAEEAAEADANAEAEAGWGDEGDEWDDDDGREDQVFVTQARGNEAWRP
ncbi:uncharacterized protein AMSG_02116 [Thecamonas trahens ATCC 50062]|uniref:Uncharacterized protein n=1 Tax=Thecamonas trahens ATCC 50062 TaxID=461836 RepID=A0A0L0DX57_THETB|nr:hypothetical protein AMSG_02116 [Thecamonas trahens ATCC 50062]KNC56103.1 hypothetical protein AMSG_02116 [Thecamonas trahens ATCC 50062]|eukprot:XP_013761145.1 hypothetical protein AMSG_02116 [Thecamonas trahens ATCC 50062]